ncbi:mannitol dehydrogenase family protein [Youxingia wuxianensis]|uniref:Mannitol dehydrogenase family protein n=1 Tax=Youxingia wuxianensis TaxID=2763678 RepID=A0A926EQW0_9FIRM|nr:mannitol dehydrogenase family protein [Youxingia wuxianensis]MBC8584635.1 mannitol dehydrogenase family protein [Youxingia wuxianensis]
MPKFSIEGLSRSTVWEAAGIQLPKFDIHQMVLNTCKTPRWIHFGAGNIFRGFIAALQNTLLEEGLADCGIIASDTFDYEIIDKIFTPYDNLSLLVIMNPDGSLEKRVVASVAKSIKGDSQNREDWARLIEIFQTPSLQMASFTITEKGYSLRSISGQLIPVVSDDIANGPATPRHTMAVVAALALARYEAGSHPIAFVSMDNCSHNGEKLQNAVTEIACGWKKNGFVSQGFIDYLNDPKKVSFPWSMIDKITPRPSPLVQKELEKSGILGMDIVCTDKNTFIAPFVNAEAPQYLVIEDSFPNGRMPLEKAGVLFADRNTVENTERMKVTTCLNPLHTALAVYGCLLGYTSIAAEMDDPQLKALVEKIGYTEGMPVVVDPGILNPDNFIHEVIDRRLPNPFIPDTPQRIATDTSQKIPIRFGETIKAYVQRPDLNVSDLTYIPLAIAGWCRYLLGVDDEGAPMQVSSDPMLEQLSGYLKEVSLGNPSSGQGALKPILSNSVLFGSDLYTIGLGEKIEDMFTQLIAGKHAVRDTLKKYLD